MDLFAKGLPTRDMRRHVQIARPAGLDEATMIALTCEAADEAADADRLRKPRPDIVNAVQSWLRRGRKLEAVLSQGSGSRSRDPAGYSRHEFPSG